MALTYPNRLDLTADLDQGSLRPGINARGPVPPPSLSFGDTIPVRVRLLRPTTSRHTFRDLDLTNLQPVLSVGHHRHPLAGTWRLTFDSNTTINLAYNASASNVQAELNALTSVQNAGNLAVEKPQPGSYRLIWNENGNRNLVTVDSGTLFPTTTPETYTSIGGGTAQRETQLVRLRPDPAAQVTLTTSLDAAAVTITTTRTGNTTNGSPEIQTIDLSDPKPCAGTYALTIPDGATTNTTAALAFDSSPASLQAAIIATNSTALTGKVTVLGRFPFYRVLFDSSLGNLSPITADASGLDVPVGFQGDLDTNVATFLEHLDGGHQAQSRITLSLSNTSASTSRLAFDLQATLRDRFKLRTGIGYMTIEDDFIVS